MRKYVAALAVLTLATGCGSASGDEAADEPDVEEVLAQAREELDRQSPGVTDDTITVGVTYVDTESIRAVIDLDHGDYEAAYRALFEHVNANGGIHGRRVEPIFAPVNPTSSTTAQAACSRLTGEGVFVVMGYFQADVLPCYLEDHDTAMIGGPMTAEQLERADPPWFSADAGSDVGAEVIRAYAESGALDGQLGVVAVSADEPQLRGEVLPLLDEFGIEPVASGLINDRTDASSSEVSAVVGTSVEEIADRFDDAEVDRVLVVGPAGASWAHGAAPTDYRPRLLFTSLGGINAYVSDESSDVSLLNDAAAGSLYDGEDVASLPAMRQCLDIQEAAGVVTMPSDDSTGDPGPLVGPSIACRNVTLFRAIADSAGPDLTYGAFRRAGEGLGEVTIPGYPDPFNYGRPPSADGDPVAYLFRWDPAERQFVVQDRR